MKLDGVDLVLEISRSDRNEIILKYGQDSGDFRPSLSFATKYENLKN